MKKICENCKKPIKKKEHYFEVHEHKEDKIVGTKFVHKTCQDLFNQKMNQSNMQGLQVAGKLMEKAEGMLKSLGIEPKRVVTIP